MKTAAEILAKKGRKLITIPAERTIYEALTKMTEHKVGSILVSQGKDSNIVGIWTERDLMRNTLVAGFEPRTALIGDYMTTGLHSAPLHATVHVLKDRLVGLFIRHILIKEAGVYIGLLSMGDIIRASLLAQDQHIRELKAEVSWEYYEQWGWERSPK
jgi:signal-transduction protein with cAMP-binding, CBS, and nucleotidyltransferase domain